VKNEPQNENINGNHEAEDSEEWERMETSQPKTPSRYVQKHRP
jgi:hypothetical protein